MYACMFVFPTGTLDNGRRTRAGFYGRFSAHAASNPLPIRQYLHRAYHCLSKKPLRKNCKHRKGPPTGDTGSSPVALDNRYYRAAKEKPSPFDKEFNMEYFLSLFDTVKPTLSTKAFLATEQRIPGLGNGVLQDILLNASIHPKRKLETFTDKDRENLFYSIKGTLSDMAEQGGRDTEKDFFGNPGGYKTKLSSKAAGNPCPRCGLTIEKESFLGGAIYFCRVCQPMK